MRINLSFGGGPHRHNNRNRHYNSHRRSYGPRVSVTLGPIGSAIVSFIMMAILAFVTFMFATGGAFIGAVISGIMLLIFIFVFINNIKAIRNGRIE